MSVSKLSNSLAERFIKVLEIRATEQNTYIHYHNDSNFPSEFFTQIIFSTTMYYKMYIRCSHLTGLIYEICMRHIFENVMPIIHSGFKQGYTAIMYSNCGGTLFRSSSLHDVLKLPKTVQATCYCMIALFQG